MALWKPFRGKRSDLDSIEKHDGWVYFTTDDGSLFFDFIDADGELQRKQITTKEAEKILGYDITTTLNSSDTEIPTSKSVLNAIDSVKIDISNMAAVVLAEAQCDASNKAAVILAEAQNNIMTEKERAEGVENTLDGRIDTLALKFEALEKLINNLPSGDIFDGSGVIDAGTIIDTLISDFNIIDSGIIIEY